MLDAFSHVEVVFEALQCRLCDCSEQENMTQALINQQLPRLISRTALSSSPERRKQSSVPAAAMLERLGVVPGGQPQGAWPAGLLVKAPTLSPLVTLSRQPKVPPLRIPFPARKTTRYGTAVLPASSRFILRQWVARTISPV